MKIRTFLIQGNRPTLTPFRIIQFPNLVTSTNYQTRASRPLDCIILCNLLLPVVTNLIPSGSGYLSRLYSTTPHMPRSSRIIFFCRQVHTRFDTWTLHLHSRKVLLYPPPCPLVKLSIFSTHILFQLFYLLIYYWVNFTNRPCGF